MEKPDFRDIVRSWALVYDTQVPMKSAARTRALAILLGNLKEQGFDKEDLNLAKRNIIYKFCYNPNHRPKQRREVWLERVKEDFENAIITYYGGVTIKMDVLTPEMENRLNSMEKKAEESRAIGEARAESEENDDSTKIDENSIITEEFLNSLPDGPEILWDEDFAKKLDEE